MTLPTGSQKWGLGLLLVLAVGLAGNLIWQFRKIQSGTGEAQVVAVNVHHQRAASALTHAADDLAKYDPDVHLAELKNLDSRPLPDEDRNPFEFVGGVVAAAAPQAVAQQEQAAPAPPPPPPLKAVGYNEMPGGKKEAMVTFNDDLSVVHEGDVIASKFKVLTISPSTVVVEDGDTHQKIDLPIAQ